MKKAQSIIEYALVLAMISVVAVSGAHLVGKHLNGAMKESDNAVEKDTQNSGKQACDALGSDYNWDSNNNICRKTTSSNP